MRGKGSFARTVLSSNTEAVAEMEFFDAKFISVTTVGLSTIALLLNLLVLAVSRTSYLSKRALSLVQVILSDKSLRTNACFRIICALVICGAVSVTSHIAHNTTILLDKTEHVAFNTVSIISSSFAKERAQYHCSLLLRFSAQ